MKAKTILAGLIFSAWSSQGLAVNLVGGKEIPMINIEKSIEAPIVNVSGRSGASFDYLIVRTCQSCKPQQYEIKPSAVFIKNNQTLDPATIESLNGKPATVMLDSESNHVNKVIYFSIGEK